MARPLMKHNPAFLSKADLIRSFVVRHADLDLVLERLREGGEGPNQHMLLIGPRGIGKTTLVLRVAAAVEAEPVLQERWYPLVFGEESYEVGTAAEFWLEAILHLADRTGDARWRAAYDELKTQRDEKRLYEQALARLMDFADEQGKRLLIIAENLNMILGEQISSDDGWVLRHTLQNEPRIMMLATATMRFDEIDSVDKAMYDLFWTHDLRPLDPEECRRLWTAITGQEIGLSLTQPLRILTGGSPRLLAILAAFASGLSFRELMTELTQLVDDHTSYFKSSIESLPVLERKVYVALADIWSPATAREVAASARVEVNKASSLLHRLVSRGAVVEVKQERRKTRYQVAERMYNIYHLMRRRAGENGRVKAVVDFMVHLYEQEELVRVARSLTEEACAVEPASRGDYFFAYAGILQRAGSPKLQDDILTSTDDKFFELAGALSLPRALLPGSIGGDTEASLRADLARRPDDAVTWMRLALLLGDQTERIEEAVRTARRVTEIAPEQAKGWLLVGALLTLAERWEEAADACERSLELAPDDKWALVALGEVRLVQERYMDAERAFRGALEKGADNLGVWQGLGRSLARQDRWEDAEEPLRHVIALLPDNADAWVELGFSLAAQSKFDEAVRASRHAVRCDPSDVSSWLLMGLVEFTRGEYNEAEKAYRKAIEVGGREDASGNLLRVFVEKRFQTPAAATRAGRRFLRETDGRSVGLDALARKVFTSGWSKLYPDAETWSREAVTAEPHNLRFRFTLACIIGALGKWPAALAEAPRFLADLAYAREDMSEIINFFINAAAAGQAREALTCLTASPAKLHFDPLIVALQMVLGEDYNAPQEVVEVARDVVARIDACKRAPVSPPASADISGAALEAINPSPTIPASAATPITESPPTKPKPIKTKPAKPKSTKPTAKKRPQPSPPPRPARRTKPR